MRPDLLRTFLAVARSGNITRAATVVHRAQSSVSDQVQLLEEEMGTTLFRRTRTGLTLTSAGAAFRPYAEEILALLDEARTTVAALAGNPAGSLTVGTLETIASTRMPQWLSSFRSVHPDINVQVKIAGSGELREKAAGGDIDVAFSFDRDELDERLLRRSLGTEPLALVAAPHGRPPRMIGDLRSLGGRRFVATTAGCVYRQLFDKAFAAAGIPAPPLAAEVDSIRTLVQLVATGTELALVPRLAVADSLSKGDLVELPWPGPARTVSLVALCRRRRVQPAALSDLLHLVGAGLRARGTVERQDA